MAGGNWKMIAAPAEFIAMWRAQQPDVETPRLYEHPSGLTALVGRESFDSAGDDMRWHIHLRFGNRDVDGRLPTWEELVNAAHELRPGVVFVIGIPPKSWWKNATPDVLHLHETRDELLIQMFKDNAMGAVPT